MKKIILFKYLFCAFIYQSVVFAGPKWPMILMEHQMMSEVVVIFHEDIAAPKWVELKGSNGENLKKKTKVKDPFGIPCCIHEVTFKNLRPNTAYALNISGLTKKLWFKTAGNLGKVFLGGDSRSDSSMRRKINKTRINI